MIDLIWGLFLLFVITAVLMMVGIAVLEVALQFDRLLPVRRILSRSRHRWLAVLLPFGPAASIAMLNRSGLLLGAWEDTIFASLGLSTYFAAVFSGWWLALPRDQERPLRGWRAIFVGLILWGCAGPFFIGASGIFDYD